MRNTEMLAVSDDANKFSHSPILKNFFFNRAETPIPPKEIFFNLLVYLDLSICLNDIFENLKNLDEAIAEKNINDINSIAHRCIYTFLHCEMFPAIEPLRRLTRLKNLQQSQTAETLYRQISAELENFRSKLSNGLENVERIEQIQSLN